MIETMTRKEANMLLLEILKDYLTQNTDIRFGQALINLGLVRQEIDDSIIPITIDPYNEEPQETLLRVCK